MRAKRHARLDDGTLCCFKTAIECWQPDEELPSRSQLLRWWAHAALRPGSALCIGHVGPSDGSVSNEEGTLLYTRRLDSADAVAAMANGAVSAADCVSDTSLKPREALGRACQLLEELADLEPGTYLLRNDTTLKSWSIWRAGVSATHALGSNEGPGAKRSRWSETYHLHPAQRRAGVTQPGLVGVGLLKWSVEGRIPYTF